MELFPAEIWFIIQVIVDLCLITLFLFVIKQVRYKNKESNPNLMGDTTGAVMSVLEEAEGLAKTFNAQLKEKQRIIRRLNDGLDSKIIAMDLLLNRADVFLKSHENGTKTADKYRDVCKLQEEIMTLSDEGLGGEVIASRLGIEKKEAELVINLREKFKEMEKS